MNEFILDDTFSPWEMALSRLKAGDTMSAARFLALMEQDETVDAEFAAQELEEKGIGLDVSDLPRIAGSSRSDERAELEGRLYREGKLMENLEDRDPLYQLLEDMGRNDPAADPGEALIRANFPRVYEIAGEFLDRGVLLVDLFQEGSLAVWKAVAQETSVEDGIRQAMARAVTLQAHANGVGGYMAQAAQRYRQADRALLTRLGRNPVEEEIAQEMGVSPQEAAAIGKMLREAESMERIRRDNEPPQEDPDDENAVEDTAYFQSRQRIDEMLSGLSGQDAKILTLRFGLDGKPPRTAQQVGRELNMTVDEVTAREAAALASLRK